VFVIAVALLPLFGSSAFAAFPQLANIRPAGGQRGTVVEFQLNGQRLADAQELLFYAPGFEVVELKAEAGSVKAKVKIAPDCQLGEHAVRVRCATGVSELRTFYVGNLPEVAEKEPNSDFAAPQVIEKNVTVTGFVNNEDVDYFVVDLKKGERLNVEVEGIRLANTLFDPYVSILDLRRFELASDDDTPLVWQDAITGLIAPEDGKFIVQVRESSYGGNGASLYRLHVGNFPRPTAVYPAGGKVGETVDLKFVGDPTGPIVQKVTLPGTAKDRYGVFAQDSQGMSPSPNWFRLTDLGNVLEQEPNDEHGNATTGDCAYAFNGVIDHPGDVDCFRFTAKKGQAFTVNCYARRIRSPLDSVMQIFRFNGPVVANNDDLGGPDSQVRFSPNDDKEYVIRVTDHLGRGGPDFVYRIEFSAVEQSLNLSIPAVRLYTQDRHAIAVPKGGRFLTMMAVTRNNFGGEVEFFAEGLPAGVTLKAEKVPAGLNVVPIVFEAAADAPLGGTLTNLQARTTDPNLKISGGMKLNADLVIGNPGQSVYWRYVQDRLAVCVVDEVPYQIRVVQPKAPLVQSGSLNIKVVVERKGDFKGPVVVELPFRPPGVSANPNLTIPPDQTEGTYTLSAAGNAELKEWKLAMMSSTDLNGQTFQATDFFTLRVAEPYISLVLERTAVEQGATTEIFAKITPRTKFEGSAKIKLIGLPHKTACEDLELTAETTELDFKVVTEKDSPVGKHRNIFCQLVIVENGEQIFHSLGNTELRIDAPLPPKAAPAQPAPNPTAVKTTPATPQQPAPRRLTRLEQLRLEAQQRAEEEKKNAGGK